MRQLSIRLDDDISPLLAKHKNQNRIVNEALRLYLSDTTTGAMDNIARGFRVTAKYLKEIDSKLDYLTSEPIKPIQTTPQVFDEPRFIPDSQDPDDKPKPLGDLLREKGTQ